MRSLTPWTSRAIPVGRVALPALAAVAASLAIGCGGGDSRATAVSDELRRDLELASVATVTLPPSQRTRFVSAVERGPDPAPRAPSSDRARATTPTRQRANRAPARSAGVARGETAARAESPVQEAPAPVAQTQPVEAPAADVTPAPVVAQAPEPAPEVNEPGMGAGSGPNAGGEAAGTGGGRGNEGRGRGIGDIFGGVIGVVIRGGGVDGDNCERHPPRRGRGPVAVGMPGDFPVMGPGQYPAPRMPRGGVRMIRVIGGMMGGR